MTLPPGWKRIQIQDIATVVRGASPRPKGDPRYYGGVIPRLMVADVTRDGRYVVPNIDFLTHDGARRSRLMPKGTLAIVCSGSVGIPAILAVDACIHDGFLALEEVSTECDIEYLFEVFSWVYRKLERTATHGGVFTNLTATILKEFELSLPPREEQNAIANVLRKWDIAFEITKKQIAAKKLLHIARERKLLRSRVRAVPLSTVLKPVVRKVSRPEKPYWVLGIRSHGKGTFRHFVENPSTVTMDELYRVRYNDFIVNITFAWEGAVAFVRKDDEDCLVSHRFPTYHVDVTKALPDYLRHVIVQKRFIRSLGLISPGGAGRNRVLNKKDFLNLRIGLPEINDQKRIGDVLNTSLKEISLLENQLELLKKQKRGLMQKLLTGQWRVKTAGVST